MLRRKARKVIMRIVKDDEAKAVGNPQLRGGQDARCEAAVDSMHDIFATNKQFYLLKLKTHSTP